MPGLGASRWGERRLVFGLVLCVLMIMPAAAAAAPSRGLEEEVTNPRHASAGFVIDAQDSGTSKDLFAVRFLDLWSGWLGGAGGTLSRTPNSGTDWVAVQSGGDHWIEDIWLADRDHVYAGATAGWGKDKDPNYGGHTHAIGTDPQHLMRNWSAALMSKDGGITWEKRFLPTNFIVTSLRFFDHQNGYFTSFGAEGHDDSDTWITHDGGASWVQWRNNGCWCHWSDSETLGKDAWWIAGENFFFTGDGGSNWNLSKPPGWWTMLGISFADPLHGWAVGRAGMIANSSDGGRTWSEQNSTVSVDLNSVDFVSLSEGWAVGDAGTVLHTVDGGATWTKMVIPTSLELEDVDFPDARFGWAVGKGGTVLFIHDGIPPPPPKGNIARVAVMPGTASLSVGEVATFSALGYDTAGSPIPGLSYAWSLSSNLGTLTPLGPDKVEFRATAAGTASLAAETSYNGSSSKGSATIGVKEANRPPAAPLLGGDQKGLIGALLAFDFRSVDPDGDEVKFWIDWADGVNGSAGPIASGTAATATHAWAASGIYGVKAVAEDASGSFSSWSTVLTVSIAPANGTDPDLIPPAIVHSPVAKADARTALAVAATVTDDSGVDKVSLHYLATGASWKEILMTGAADFTATIPGPGVVNGELRYYIEATDKAGNRATHPPGAPDSYHAVQVASGGPPPPPPPPPEEKRPPTETSSIFPFIGVAAAAIVVLAVGIALARRGKKCDWCGTRHRRGEQCRRWQGWS